MPCTSRREVSLADVSHGCAATKTRAHMQHGQPNTRSRPQPCAPQESQGGLRYFHVQCLWACESEHAWGDAKCVRACLLGAFHCNHPTRLKQGLIAVPARPRKQLPGERASRLTTEPFPGPRSSVDSLEHIRWRDLEACCRT